MFADLTPRPMDDLVARKRGIGLLTAVVSSASDLRRYRSLTWRQHSNTRPRDHCDQLGIAWSDLPMCQ